MLAVDHRANEKTTLAQEKLPNYSPSQTLPHLFKLARPSTPARNFASILLAEKVAGYSAPTRSNIFGNRVHRFIHPLGSRSSPGSPDPVLPPSSPSHQRLQLSSTLSPSNEINFPSKLVPTERRGWGPDGRISGGVFRSEAC